MTGSYILYDHFLRPHSRLSRGTRSFANGQRTSCVCTSAKRTLTYLNLCFAIGKVICSIRIPAFLSMEDLIQPIEKTGRVECRRPRCGNENKEPPKSWKSMRVDESRIKNKGGQICARSTVQGKVCQIFTEVARRTRQMSWNGRCNRGRLVRPNQSKATGKDPKRMSPANR